jgi:glutathione S-transferase
MITLHQMHVSGNCYKARLCARQLGIPIALKDYGLHDGATRTPDYLAKNPNGRVPMLELDDGRFLPESGAILNYLAHGSHLIPEDRWDRAQMLQWMFFEQYSHEPYVAVARFWLKFADKAALAKKEHLVPEWMEKGNAALDVMETHLTKHDWFAGNRYSIADIALYGYTHSAEDGQFQLSRYPAVQRWLARVEATPGYIPLAESW